MHKRVIVTAALVALILGSAAAQAGKPVVVVAPFHGPHAELPERAVLSGLRRRALVLSPARYKAVARGIVARTQSADDLAAVAHELGAKWIVTGTLAREGGHFALGISLRDGATGHVRSRLRYNLSSSHCPPTLLRTLAVEIAQTLDTVQAPEPDTEEASPPVRSTTRPRPGPAQAANTDDDETPPTGPGDTTHRAKQPEQPEPEEAEATPEPPKPEPPPKPKPKPAPSAKRPRWAHWFELGVGPSLTGRSFATNPTPPRFSSSVVAGVHADLVFYPFAFSWSKAYGIFSGLGLGVTFDKPVWPDSTSVTAMDQRFPTSETRIEGGLRWKFTLYKPMPRPQLTLIVQGGLHEFQFARGPGGVDVVGVPDVAYVYASIGGGLTVHFADWSWIHATFVYHAVTNFGAIEAASEYGLAAGYGLRFSGGLDFLVWKGIRVGAEGFYERFNIIFGYDPAEMPAKIADSASDTYYGASLLLGYVF